MFVKFFLFIILNGFLLEAKLAKLAPNVVSESIRKVKLINRTTNAKQCAYGTTSSDDKCIECSKTYVQQNTKSIGIVGGFEARAHSWPAHVLTAQNIDLRVLIDGVYYQITRRAQCAGTIINRWTIVTAAHCIMTEVYQYVNGQYRKIVLNDPFNGKMYEAYAGTHDITLKDKAPAVKLKIRRVVRHAQYDGDQFKNDIALFLLAEPIEFNEYIQSACLPNPEYGSYPKPNSSAFAVGWGTLSSGGLTPTKLQNVRITAYDGEYCSKVLTEIQKNWDSQLCAGEYEGGKDTCQGDSGGGIYSLDAKLGRYVLSGVTSFGEGCALRFMPGIYTRVSYYRDWITSNWITTSATNN